MPMAEMEFSQAMEDAYFEAYRQAVSRHALRSPISATSAGIAAAASSPSTRATGLTFGERVNNFLYAYWSNLLVALTFLGWTVLLPLMTILGLYYLCRATNWGDSEHWVDDLVGRMDPPDEWPELDDDSWLWNSIVIILLCVFYPMRMARIIADKANRALANLRYNQYTDAVWYRYYQITSFLRRHLITLFFSILLLSSVSGGVKASVKRAFTKETIVSRGDVRLVIDNPEPAAWWWPRKQRSSNYNFEKLEKQKMLPTETVVEEWNVISPEELLERDLQEQQKIPHYLKSWKAGWTQEEWDAGIPVFDETIESAHEEETPTASPRHSHISKSKSRKEEVPSRAPTSEQQPRREMPFTSAREEYTLAPPPRSSAREGLLRGEWVNTLLSEQEPFESIVERAWEKNNAFQLPRTNVGNKMIYCMACRQWHCCELPY